MNKKITIFETFAGIGSQLRALENVFGKENVESLGQTEWYLDAIIGYNAIHNVKVLNNNQLFDHDLSRISRDSKKPVNKIKFSEIEKLNLLKSKQANNTFDISKTTWKDIPKNIDIFTYSFPCQDLSQMGKHKGFEEGSKTRSSLLWEISRIIKECNENDKERLPKYLLMENVPQVVASKNLDSFNRFLEILENVGYLSKYYLLTASDFGSPQKRNRCFCISIRKDFAEQIKWEWPNFEISNINKSKISDILEKDNLDKSWLPHLDRFEKTNFKESAAGIKKCSLKGYTNFAAENYVYDKNYLGPTLTASGAQSRIKIIQDEKIRMLSAVECLKYMGFTKNDYLKMKDTGLLGETDIIYLAGNSICINVLEEIFKKLIF